MATPLPRLQVHAELRWDLIMQALQGVDLSSLKVAKGGDRVYKDECIYSFETPVKIKIKLFIKI